MKNIYFFILLIVPFITACHSLSMKKSSDSKLLDHSYFQLQADWHYLKGEQKSLHGLYYQAIDSFKNALVYHSDSFFLHFRLLDEYLKAGLQLQAFKQCNTLLKKYPDNMDLHLKMGKIYENNNLDKKALAEYNWVLTKKPDHVEALYRKAALHVQKQNFSQARSTFTVLSRIGKEENLYRVYYFLGQIDKKENRKQKALLHFNRSLYLYPDFMPAALELFSFYQEAGQTDKAVHVLEEFQKNAGFHPQVSLILFRFYAQQGNWDKAIMYLEPFSELDPSNWMIRVQLAWMWSQKEEYEEAITIMEETVSVYPRVSSSIYTLYASFFEQQQDFPRALEVLLEASYIFPVDTAVLFYKSVIYDQLGQTGQAIRYLKKVLEIDPDYVNALNYLAFLYAELNNDLESAERMIIKALSLSSNDSYILDTAGWVFFKRGKTQKALKYLELAHQNNASEGLIAEHLAEVYYHLNMIDKSITLYKKAIELETNENRKKELEEKLQSIQLAV